MAKELDYGKLVAALKANKELKQSEAAQKQGLTVGQVSMAKFTQAQVEAGVYAKAPATQASVVKLRKEGNRWELIAARTGLGVAAVKAHAEAGGVLDSYTGRGRNFNGSPSGASKKTAAKSGSSKKTAAAGGRKGSAAGRKTGVKVVANKKTAAARKSGPTRNIRGGRSGRAANPS